MQGRFEEPQNATFLLLFYIILDNQVSLLSSFIRIHSSFVHFLLKKGKRSKKSLLLLRVIFLHDKHQHWMTMGSLQGLPTVSVCVCPSKKGP